MHDVSIVSENNSSVYFNEFIEERKYFLNLTLSVHCALHIVFISLHALVHQRSVKRIATLNLSLAVFQSLHVYRSPHIF